MPDIGTTIVASANTIKAAIDAAKYIKDAADSLEKADIKLKMAELICLLSDLKLENSEKEELIKELKKKLERKDTMKFDNGFMFKLLPDGNKEGPFCQVCYQTKNLEVNLQEYDSTQMKCMACGHYFDFQPQQRRSHVAGVAFGNWMGS